MRLSVSHCIIVLICSAVLHAETSQISPHIVSNSRQFIIETPDPTLATHIAVATEKLKATLLAQLQLSDQWQSPIFIVVSPSSMKGAEITISASVLAGRLHFKLSAHTPTPLQSVDFFRSLTQILCSELASRTHRNAQAGDPLLVAPLWVSEGLWQMSAETIGYIKNRETNLKISRSALAEGRVWDWSQLVCVQQMPRDSTEAQMFSAHSQAFVESLLTLPDGPRKLRMFLGALATAKDWQSAFFTAFQGDFSSVDVLEKWWLLRLHARAQNRQPQAQTFAETKQRLDEIILTAITVTDKKTGVASPRNVGLIELAEYRSLDGMKEQLDRKLTDMFALQAISNPLYRESITAYARSLQFLRQRKFKDFTKEIARAERAHQRADTLAEKIALRLDNIESLADGATSPRP